MVTKKLLLSLALLTSFVGTAAFAYYTVPPTNETPEEVRESNNSGVIPHSFEASTPSSLVAFTNFKELPLPSKAETPSITMNPTSISPISGAEIVPGEQPKETLLLQGALVIPFTTFTLKAGNEQVEVSEIVVKLSGFGDKNIFEGVSIVDGTDTDFDGEKMFRSDRTAVFKDSRTIPANSEMSFTVYGNVTEELTDYDGQMPILSIQTVRTSKSLRGNLPIMGAAHTVNSSLRLGSATTLLSQFDPSVPRTQYINDVDVRFAGIRITAGTGEHLQFSGITFEQTGTAGPGDITNVSIVADGISYPADVDEREYSAKFENPIRIEKGRSIDVYIRGDITTTGSNRTLVFEIGAPDDIVLVGEQFGFQTGDISAEGNTATDGGSVFITSDGTTEGEAGDPFFAGSEFTISGGAFTSVGKN